MGSIPLSWVPQVQTLGEVIRRGARWFEQAGLHFGHGCDNAWDEAAYLALHALGLSPAVTDHDLATCLTKHEAQAVRALFDRRVKERRPVAYLTRAAWFAGLRFYVDERVLVPRSPIAELIEAGFEPWVRQADVKQVLDLCTGSGCIGIACAYAFPAARVDLSDVSAEALEVAQENIRRHRLTARVRAVQSDLFEHLQGRTYELMVCNPPYVTAAEMATLPKEHRHEPVLGLRGGDDGLDVVMRLLADAKHYLSGDGILVMEVGDSERALTRTRPDVPFLWLEFERGGHGVFLLTAEQCAHYF